LRSARNVRANPLALEELRDAVASAAAEEIAAVNLRHLTMAAELRAIFDALSQALMRQLEKEGVSRGCSGLLVLARLALAIQQIERTALAIGDDSIGNQPNPGRGGHADGGLPFRVEDLSTEELTALARLAELADRARQARTDNLAVGGDGLPLPPACPG